MKFSHIHKQTFFGLVFLLSMGALPAAPQQDSAPAMNVPLANATIADINDKVQVQLPGQSFSAPSLGETLPAESTIKTDNGQILLRLEDGSEVLVHPHTQVVLKQPASTNWQRLQIL